MNTEKKKYEIFVGDDRHDIDTHTITYERVVDLYLGEGKPPSKQYVIKYSHGPPRRHRSAGHGGAPRSKPATRH